MNESTKPETPHGGSVTDSPRFTPIGELLAEPDEDIPFVVDDLLPAGGLSLLVGAPKTGKSTAARCLAVAMAQQGTWFGRGCSGGRVAVLDLEGKRSEIRRHFNTLGAQPDDPISVRVGPVRLREGDTAHDWLTWKLMTELVHPPALVIVDPMARLVRVREGNDYHETSAVLEGFIDLARTTGIHLMFVHHARKGSNQGVAEFGEEVLGSTGFFASVDTAISLQRDRNTGARLAYATTRYGRDIDLSFVTLDEETGVVSIGVTKAEAAGRRVEDAILDFVSAQSQPVTRSEIEGADAISASAKNIREAVKRLCLSGRMAGVEGVRRGSMKYLVPHTTGQ